MQKKLNTIFVIIFIMAVAAQLHAQKTNWLKGAWQGKSYLPGNDTQYYKLSLEVTRIKGENFEGILKTFKATDSSIHFDSEVKGIVKGKKFGMIRTRILYAKSDVQNKWKVVNCNNCNPPEWIYRYEDGKFIIRGAVKNCDKECDWVTELQKDFSEFDSSGKVDAYALLDDNNKPDKSIFAAAADGKPAAQYTTANSTDGQPNPAAALAEVENPDKRIALLPAGAISPVAQKQPKLLQYPAPAFAVAAPAFTVSKDIYIPQRIVMDPGAQAVIENKKDNIIVMNTTPAPGFNTPGYSVDNLTHVQARTVLIPAGDVETGGIKKAATAMTSLPKFRKSKPSYNVANSMFIQPRIELITANNIELLKKNRKSPIAQRTNKQMTTTKPYLILPDTRFTVAKTEPAVITAVAGAAAAAVNVPAIQKPLIALPEGFKERKQSVVRTLSVNTDSLLLRVYDNGVVDGDIVSVIYNDQVVIDKLSLTTRIIEVKIPVAVNSSNSLVFHAHNLGQFPPNTAKLEIIYGNKREELTVSSDLTVSSTIDIVRQ